MKKIQLWYIYRIAPRTPWIPIHVLVTKPIFNKDNQLVEWAEVKLSGLGRSLDKKMIDEMHSRFVTFMSSNKELPEKIQGNTFDYITSNLVTNWSNNKLKTNSLPLIHISNSDKKLSLCEEKGIQWMKSAVRRGKMNWILLGFGVGLGILNFVILYQIWQKIQLF